MFHSEIICDTNKRNNKFLYKKFVAYRRLF